MPVRCAEGISARSFHAFLGKEEPGLICSRIKHIKLTGPSGVSALLAHEIDGYILDRSIFDRTLAARAESEGAEVATCSPATGLERSGDGWLVKVSSEDHEVSIRAGVVVGADGIESLVGRWAGIKTHTSLDRMESCYQYRLTGLDLEENVIELAFGSRIAPGAYAWIFPKGAGEANVGIGLLRSAAQERITARDYLDRWVETRFPDAGCSVGVSGGVIVSPTLPSISTHGLLLAGDAAHQINPLSGAGISSGMRAGWLAGKIAAEQIWKGDISGKALKRYDREWRRILGRLHESHFQLADTIFQSKDEEFDRVAGELASLPAERCTMFEAVRSVLRTRPPLLFKLAGYFRHWGRGAKRGYPEIPPEPNPAADKAPPLIY